VFDAEVSKTLEDKERARRQQLRRLKMKFGLTVNQDQLLIIVDIFWLIYMFLLICY